MESLGLQFLQVTLGHPSRLSCNLETEAKSREVGLSECGFLHLEGTGHLPIGPFLKEKITSLGLFIVSASKRLRDLRHCAVL